MGENVMAQVRLSKQSASYSPVPSPDSSSSDDAVQNELRAVSETALIAQGIELVGDLQEGEWISTDDYSTSDADSDREDSLTTSDSKNRLTPAAEQADARRGSSAKLPDRRSENAELVMIDRDIDNELYIEDLENIVAGVGPRNARIERDIDPKLDNLKNSQSFRDKGVWMKG
jgi:hypothetical protein